MRTGGMPRTTVPTVAISCASDPPRPQLRNLLGPLPLCSSNRHSTDGETSDQVPRRGEAPSVSGLRYTIKFGYAIYPVKWTTGSSRMQVPRDQMA
jgi:hypothetical protein